MIELAQYIKLGFHLFPIKDKGKEPLTANGFHGATNDRNQLRQWYSQHPGCNWGIATQASGLSVIDIDEKSILADLCMEVGPELNAAPRVLTSKGYHVYTRRPTTWTPMAQRVGIMPHVDVTNYVVAPPSVHPSGHVYKWDITPWDHAIPELPEWFRGVMDDGIPRKTPQNAPERTQGGLVPHGARNEFLASRAGSMRRIGLSVMAIFGALKQVYLEECVQNPPYDDERILKIAKSMGKYDPEVITDRPEAGSKLIFDWASKVSESEQVDWLWQDMIPKGFVSVLAGDGEMGKSWMTYSLAASLTAGKALPGGGSNGGGGKALFLDAENTRGLVRDRLAMSGADTSRCAIVRGTVIDDPDNPEEATLKNVEAITQAVEENGFELIVIDPVLSFAIDANSNSDQEVRNMLRPYMALARNHNIAIVLVIHLNKVDSKDIRRRVQGAPAWINVPRSCLYFGPKSGDEDGVRLVKLFKCNLVMHKPAYEYTLIQDKGIEFGCELEVAMDTLMDGEATQTTRVRGIIEAAVACGGRPSAEIIADVAAIGGSKALFYKVLKQTKGEGITRSEKVQGEWRVVPAADDHSYPGGGGWEYP